MIPYAKWVWKASSYQRAFIQLAKHELVFLGLSILVIIVVMSLNSKKEMHNNAIKAMGVGPCGFLQKLIAPTPYFRRYTLFLTRIINP